MKNTQSSLLDRNRLFLVGLIVYFTFVGACRTGRLESHPPHDRHQPYNYVGQKGMVVAAHPLAAEAGLAMLKKGGNAIDAAIATAFALNAAEPFASGIGGGGFMVIYLAEEKTVTAINFREKAPAKAHREMFLQDGKTNETWRRTHGLAVAVPGALSGWALALRKYGTKRLDEVMQSGIRIAEEGFAVSKTFSKINKDEYEKLNLMAGDSCCYLNDGFPFEPGDTFRNVQLADTFRLIASKGIEEFYEGQLAEKIVTAVQEHGGIITLEDLAGYEAEEHSPVKGVYKDCSIYSSGLPASGGLHVIQLLNILENWPVSEWEHNSPVYIHHLSEAFRFIFADRAQYLGDPDFIDIPIASLLSKKYARQISSRINPNHTLGSYPYGEFDEWENEKENTTHLCVLDCEGNIVSLTQTINHFFGSGIIPEKTGFLLNNEMDDFSRATTSPNAPGPKKRPLSSQGPLIVFKGDRPFLALGSPGGTRIFTSLFQIVVNTIEFSMSLDEAIEAPRFFSYSTRGKASDISLEARFSDSVLESLKKMGHGVEVKEAYDTYFGGAQGIMILWDKRLIYGGADSRRDGYGAGY